MAPNVYFGRLCVATGTSPDLENEATAFRRDSTEKIVNFPSFVLPKKPKSTTSTITTLHKKGSHLFNGEIGPEVLDCALQQQNQIFMGYMNPYP